MRYLCMLLAAGWLSAATAQYWTGPFRLTGSGDDVNPSACKEFLAGGLTCMVWQKNDFDCWNIYSSFCDLYNGNGWDQEQPITRDSALDNINPAVACLNDWQDHPSYWCVWERREGPVTGSIMASFITFRDSWNPPVVIGRTIHTDGDSAMPGIITIEGRSADTVWVAWRNHDTGGTYISYVFHIGDSWSRQQIAAFGEMKHARLGRFGNWQGYRPLLVWEQAGDIWYSTYQSGGWTPADQVAPSPAADRSPDVVNAGYWPGYVVWESERDGDTAIFLTHGDTFSLAQRVCNASGAGRNWSPAATDVMFTTRDYWSCAVTWVTDRNGNPDIYSSIWNQGDGYVDLNPGNDLAPVVTSMGGMTDAQMAWVLWQSDRSGTWDIYGGYMYNTGVGETENREVRREKAGASIVRGVLWLGAGTVPQPGASDALGLSRAALLNAAGRQVLYLRPGANDVSHLAPGVYFVRMATGEGRMANSKVVITR